MEIAGCLVFVFVRERFMIAAENDVLLTRKEAADFLGLKTQTLASWAVSGKYGLPMVKVGARVKYRRADLTEWLRQRTCTHTGEFNKAA